MELRRVELVISLGAVVVLKEQEIDTLPGFLRI